jgi:hypothetical protein
MLSQKAGGSKLGDDPRLASVEIAETQRQLPHLAVTLVLEAPDGEELTHCRVPTRGPRVGRRARVPGFHARPPGFSRLVHFPTGRP